MRRSAWSYKQRRYRQRTESGKYADNEGYQTVFEVTENVLKGKASGGS
ncbi:MAG TPA: hypothetical protein VKT49_11655 [Bryobacteraceae bacterium]|nr:hypothetical protein [Bryobacteraceae bacterium]